MEFPVGAGDLEMRERLIVTAAQAGGVIQGDLQFLAKEGTAQRLEARALRGILPAVSFRQRQPREASADDDEPAADEAEPRTGDWCSQRKRPGLRVWWLSGS